MSSATNAIKNVMPLLNKCVSGELISIENTGNKILDMLDQCSGIDMLSLSNGNIKGIACRVQWGRNWDSFTIRLQRHTGTKTEYQKRIDSINNGSFYPYLTMQAYLDNKRDNKILSLAVIKTIDLYELIDTHNYLFRKRKSDNVFLYVNWLDIKHKTDKKIITR